MMHTNSAVINGSCAMHMLWCDGECPTNLNIVVPAESGLCMVLFIIDTLHYERIENTQINYSHTELISSHEEFQCGPLRITVSEAFADGIFEVITKSHTTADMMVMTAGGLTVFYPLWTSKGIAVTNSLVLHTAPRQNIGCIKQPTWHIHAQTMFLNGPCQSLCPTLWNNVADAGQYGLVMEWDHRFPMKALLKCSNVIWCL
jgi:hypothetical protein